MGEMPAPEGQNKNFGTFLQADDLKKGVNKVTVIGVRPAPAEMQFSQYLLDVEFQRRKYVLGIKTDSTTYDALYQRFGTDTDKWKGVIEVRPRYSDKYPTGFVEILG